MESIALHFCHANGFPARSYDVLLNALSEQYHVSYLEMHGHKPQYPVTNNWLYLVDELIDELLNTHKRPVVAVGHSMGGALIYMAARKRPDLFQQIILLDPPILDKFTSVIVGVAKRLNLIDRITPAGRTDGRQEVFENYEHAYDYFSQKTLFKETDPRCLRDYIQHGTVPHGNGLKLKYTASTEVAIYRTLPHKFDQHNKPLTVPAALLYGETSNVVRPGLIKHMKHTVGMKTQGVQGGHLFPLEYPEQTATHIKNLVETL